MVGRSRAAQARMQRVLERAKAKQTIIEQAASPAPTASETVEIAASAPVHLSPYDQARVDKWIRDRVVAEVPGLCWRCRRPFISGQKFIDVRGDEAVVRFHTQCESEWRDEQEVLARKALGLMALTSRETAAP